MIYNIDLNIPLGFQILESTPACIQTHELYTLLMLFLNNCVQVNIYFILLMKMMELGFFCVVVLFHILFVHMSVIN